MDRVAVVISRTIARRRTLGSGRSPRAPLFDERRVVRIWGPPSATESLRTRLTRYLSPPLFPVRLRDLGACRAARWTSGHDLVAGTDLLIHDGQYTTEEYAARVGWGHSRVEHAAALADSARAKTLLLFHHDPNHDDRTVDGLVALASGLRRRGHAAAAREGDVVGI